MSTRTRMIVNTNGQRSQNSGTVTIPLGNTNVTVVHSLIGTPKIVIVTGKDLAAAGAYVSARNSTHITIAIPHAAVVDAELDWYAEV